MVDGTRTMKYPDIVQIPRIDITLEIEHYLCFSVSIKNKQWKVRQLFDCCTDDFLPKVTCELRVGIPGHNGF